MVVVEAPDDGAERLPVDKAIDDGEPVAVLPHVLVGLPEKVRFEGVHACLMGLARFKFNRGDLEDTKTTG